MAQSGHVGLDVHGLEDVKRALREASGSTKDLSKAHRKVAKIVEQESRNRAATRGTPQQAKAKNVLVASGTSQGAGLRVKNTSRIPFGLGAFFGSLAYSQFPEWVGNRWDLLAGDGPYIIAETIRDERDHIVDALEDEIVEAFRRVGFEVTNQGE